jgi:PKD repeat protein
MKFPIPYLLVCLILFPNFYLTAQRSASQISPTEKLVLPSNAKSNGKNLIASFAVKNRIGVAPMPVQFKDMSVGQATKWTWTFGDGQTDTIKNPLHTYQAPGKYTVKLTVLDATSSSSITRNDYITVTAEGACDTLAFPLAGDYVYYEIVGNGSGYVSGNNSYGDLAKASFFDAFEPQSTLIGGILEFAIAKKSLASDKPVKFVAWDSDGTTGAPMTALADVEIPISQIVQEVEFGWPTTVFFSDPPAISNAFFLGLELPQSLGDTLALFTNYDDDTENGNGWEQHDNGNWYPYSNNQFSWNINIDHAIFPLICHTTGISNHLLDSQLLIYPVPATDQLNIMLLDPNYQEVSVAITDITGRIVYQHPYLVKAHVSIDVSQLKKGTYVLRLNHNKLTTHRKIIVW